MHSFSATKRKVFLLSRTALSANFRCYGLQMEASLLACQGESLDSFKFTALVCWRGGGAGTAAYLCHTTLYRTLIPPHWPWPCVPWGGTCPTLPTHPPPSQASLGRIGKVGKVLILFHLGVWVLSTQILPKHPRLVSEGPYANLTFRILDIRGPHLFIFVALRAQHELTHRSHSINVCWKKVGRQKEEWEESVVLSL